jgi:hypothetical protein
VRKRSLFRGVGDLAVPPDVRVTAANRDPTTIQTQETPMGQDKQDKAERPAQTQRIDTRDFEKRGQVEPKFAVQPPVTPKEEQSQPVSTESQPASKDE